MKTVAKIAGAILVCLVLVLVVLRITGLNPIGDTPGPRNYPGLWLSGTGCNYPGHRLVVRHQISDGQSADANLVFDSSLRDNGFHRS